MWFIQNQSQIKYKSVSRYSTPKFELGVLLTPCADRLDWKTHPNVNLRILELNFGDQFLENASKTNLLVEK